MQLICLISHYPRCTEQGCNYLQITRDISSIRGLVKMRYLGSQETKSKPAVYVTKLCDHKTASTSGRYAVKLPQEMFQKFQGKAVQSKTLWPNLNKMNEIIFFTMTQNPREPSLQTPAPDS